MSIATTQTAYELTPTQEAMLLYALYAPQSPAYFEQFCYSYRGPLQVPHFIAAWERVINRHSILRTSFLWNGESEPRQVVHERVELPFTFCDWSELTAAEQNERLTDFLETDRQRGFDLSQAPLLRLSLIRTGVDSFYIVLSNHHLVLDGWSLGQVRREVSQTYQALTRGEVAELSPAPVFHEYVEWLQQQNVEAESFWRQELAGFTAPNALSIDKAPASFPGANAEFAEQMINVPEALSQQLQACARRHRLTMSTIAQAAWAVLLRRYCNTDDVMFGITVAGRPYDFPEIDSMVGLLINTLPLRVRLSANDVASTCFQQLQRKVAAVREFETTSLKQIHEWSEIQRHNLPLFETLVVFENFIGHDLRLNLGGDLDLVRSHLARTNYPLVFVVNPHAELGLRAIYHRNRFEPEAIERLLNQLVMILESFATDLDKPINAMNFLSENERHKLLTEWSGGEFVPSGLQPIHRLIESQTEVTPEAFAVEHEGRRFSYAELNTRANQLAHFLRAEGVGIGSLVGIYLERSPDMIVAVLAVLKAGGAYVPLDPAYPKDRVAFMLEDSGARLVVTRAILGAALPKSDRRTICVDSEAQVIATHSSDNPVDGATTEDLAYVIYTSGSTGRPKGVMVEHRALANFVASAGEEYAIGSEDRVLQFASLCFDTSAEEIYCTLTRGATLVLRTDAMLTSAKQFLEGCARLGITIMDLPTGYWHHLTAAICADDLPVPESVKLLILGGEQAHSDHVDRWLERAPGVRLLNTYGPTEATIVTTTFDLSNHRAGPPISIGRPIRGASIYVLDGALQPVPVGLTGELFIGGADLARGYLNRADLTAEKFIPNPFAGGRLYRSGDLVRFLPDGNLEFVGRVDNQVKIRGFRIELEEVEQAITAYPAVADAVVTVREEADGDKRLSAYVVPTEASTLGVSELRSFLAETLPPHMMPASFTTIATLPLMPNGKVDRNALPAPGNERPEVEAHLVLPRTPTEEFVARVWCDVLKMDRVGIHDNFFELGGHSLLAAKVFSELQKKFSVELNLADMFSAPTIAALAEMLYLRETEHQHSDELALLLSELDELSDDEASRRLAEEMTTAGAAL